MIFTSLQHPLVKELVKLRNDRAFREKKQRVFISGKKMVGEVGKALPLDLLILEEKAEKPEGIIFSKEIRVSLPLMKKITGLTAPEGIGATLPFPQKIALEKKTLLLLLDKIRDPGNLGTLFRTALALGFEGILLTDESVDPWNEKALRAARGATFLLPFLSLKKEELLAFLKKKKFSFLFADKQGKKFETLSIKKPLILILGNEAHGSCLDKTLSCQKVAIPLSPFVESLNVAIAGAILLYEISKRFSILSQPSQEVL